MAPIHHIITPWHPPKVFDGNFQPPNLMGADSNPVLVRQLQMCPWSKANKKRAKGCGLRKNNIHCLVAFLLTAMVDISYIWFIEGYTAMEMQLDIRGVYRTMNFIDGMVALVYKICYKQPTTIRNFFVKGEIRTFFSNQQNPFATVSHKLQTGHVYTIPETNSESTWVWKNWGLKRTVVAFWDSLAAFAICFRGFN